MIRYSPKFHEVDIELDRAAASELADMIERGTGEIEELAGGVVPSALDVEIYSGGVCGRGDLVGDPVWVPRTGVGRVVGEQVCVIAQLDADSA